MRIPSDFNDKNLYRRHNERKAGDQPASNARWLPGSRRVGRIERTGATRRLLRLVVGLVLVIFLMRHAARPEIYQAFFVQPMQKVPSQAAGGVATAPQDISPQDTGSNDTVSNDTVSNKTVPEAPTRQATTATASSSTTSDERLQADLYSKNSPQFRDAVRLVELTTVEQARALLVAGQSPVLQAGPENLPVDVAGAVAHNIHTLANSLDPLAASQSDWMALATRLSNVSSDSTSNLASDPPSKEERRLFTALKLAALDAAMGRVVDGSVWRSNDLDAFYGALAQQELIASIAHVQTGVLPLLQQPEVYRGNGVAVVGKVVRGEQLDATTNAMGITKYWQLWLRPADGSDRPIVAIVANLPEALSANLTPENDAELIPYANATQVQVDGVYLKRLAYRSNEGAALAPVVVGVVAAMSGLPATNASTTDSSGNASGSNATAVGNTQWLMLAMTVFVGVAIAVVVMVRTQRENTKLRRLRSQHQSETLALPHTPSLPDDVEPADGPSESHSNEPVDHDASP